MTAGLKVGRRGAGSRTLTLHAFPALLAVGRAAMRPVHAGLLDDRGCEQQLRGRGLRARPPVAAWAA
jgi:hypothetical protein